MALLNPVYVFIVPFLFVVTLPLAVFAGITTTLAFSVLIFRVIFVYLDIALSLVARSFAGLLKHKHGPFRHVSSSSDASAYNSLSPSASTSLLRRQRRRRPSTASVMSAGSATPASDVGLGLIPSVGAERDFEGIGGWRDGDENDDEVWTTINSRLELPDRQHNRNHHRTLSGGPTTPGEGSFLMMKGRTRSPEKKPLVLASATASGSTVVSNSTSPNSSRTRAPSASRVGHTGMAQSESYFPLIMSPKQSSRRTVPASGQF